MVQPIIRPQGDQDGPPSPTLSTRSTRSFLDEDPYPDGDIRRRSYTSQFATAPATTSMQQAPKAPSNSDLLTRLEKLLTDKASEIHLAGQLGAALLQQQEELESRIRQLAEVEMAITGQHRRGLSSDSTSDSDGERDVGEETRRRLEELENDLKKWEESNQAMYATVGVAAAQGVPSIETMQSPSTSEQPFRRQRAPSLSRREAESAPSATPSIGDGADASASRRARNNAQHRNNDIALATEIGQSLLSEVRRLQALLAEKEEMLKELQKERDAVEAELESQAAGRRGVEEIVERYKEENWNLEVVTQELRAALTESQSSLQRAEHERARSLRDLATTREQLDFQKAESEKLTNQLEALRAKHETDMATMRKHTAALQRDKSDLASTLEGLKAELANQSRGSKRTNSQQGLDELSNANGSLNDELAGLGDDMDADDAARGPSRRKTGDGFPPASPGDLFSEFGDENVPAIPSQYGQSEEALRSGLAHAQRQLATLRSTLAREKAAKMELRRQLADAGGQAAWEDDSESGGSSTHGTPARNGRTPAGLRGSARGRGSAARRRGGAGAIGVPSRLGRQVSGGSRRVSRVGDTSIDSIDESEAVDSPKNGNDTAHEQNADNASLFEHHFPSANGADYDDIASDAGTDAFDSPSARQDRSFARSSRASVHSIDLDPAFAAHQHFSDEESLRSRDDGSPLVDNHNRRTTLADFMPNGRPASVASSIVSRNGRRASGLFSGFDIREVQDEAMDAISVRQVSPAATRYLRQDSLTQEAQLQTASPTTIPMTDVSTMTDFPPAPPPEPRIVVVAPPSPTTAEVGIQVTPEPAPPVILPPAPELIHVATQITSEPALEIVMSDISAQTDPESTVETRDMSTETDVVLEPVLEPVPELPDAMPIHTIDVDTQTDPLPVPEPVIVHVPVPMPMPASSASAPIPAEPMLSASSMEDRALHNQPSLSSLSIAGLASVAPRSSSKRAFEDEDLTISLAQPVLSNGKKVLTDDESEGTDRAFETETETEGEFEDARDSLSGGRSPSPTHSRSTSINDFVSVRSGTTFLTATAGEDTESDSDLEVLASPAKRFKSSRPRSSNLDSPPRTMNKVVTAEIGIQTDEWKPETVYVEVDRTPAPVAIAVMPTHPTGDALMNGDDGSTARLVKRDSINTFGRSGSPDALDEAAAEPSNFLGASTTSTTTIRPAVLERALSPSSALEESTRPDSILSSFSQATMEAVSQASRSAVDDNATAQQDAAVPAHPATLMGPPPAPSRRYGKGTAQASAVSSRKSNSSMVSRHSVRQPPPRPTSPPPADLLIRAQSPIFDDDVTGHSRYNGLLAPGMATSRSQGSNAGPSPNRGSSSANFRIRAQSSTEFNTPKASKQQQQPYCSGKSSSRTIEPHLSSARTSISDFSMRSDVSRRQSMASDRTSEGGFETGPMPGSARRGPGGNGDPSVDPMVIHAITQTMIGEFLFKYTRRAIGKGISEKRHKRFFWVHPYTKTLYWSSSDPGAASTDQSTAKSVFIEGVREVVDPNPNPPGLYQGSIIIQTPNREMKITAGTRERHDMWFNAIKYLLARPDVSSANSSGVRTAQASPQTQRSRKSAPTDNTSTPVGKLYSLGPSVSDSRLTPKASRGSRLSLGGLGSRPATSAVKRSGTAAEEYERRAMVGSPRSLRTFDFLGKNVNESIEVVRKSEIPSDFDLMADDEHWEGLENVRACCGGKHDVGSLGRKRGHSHHRHSRARSSISDTDSFAATPLQTPSAMASLRNASSRVRSKSAATLNSKKLASATDVSARRGASSISATNSPRRKHGQPPVIEASAPFAPLTLNTDLVQARMMQS